MPGTALPQLKSPTSRATVFGSCSMTEKLFLPFEDFPWFEGAPVKSVLRVERPQPHHLYWPEIDVDLTVDSIEHPERYPLKSQHRPKGAV